MSYRILVIRMLRLLNPAAPAAAGHPIRTRTLTALATPALLLLGLAWGATPAWAGAEKVQLCHVPPGNPSNRHTISVAPKAAEAHLANHNGDHLGECPASCEGGTDCFDGDPCTIDGCIDGFCDFSQPVECEEGSVCTDNVCISEQGGCVEIPANEGGECDDFVVCTANDQCQEGVCVGVDIPGCCRNDAGCKDFSACTEDLCDEATGVCSNPDVVCPEPPSCKVALCDAQSGCTTEDVVCADDGDLCTIESCDPDVGDSGACVTVNVVCPDGQVCDPDSGSCVDDCEPGLFEVDLVDPAFPPGNMLLLKDTIAGKEWVDLTATLNRSANCIQTGCDGWLGRGFNYATHAQIKTLWENAGIVNTQTGGVPTPGNISGAQFLLDTLGVTQPPHTALAIWGPGCFTGSCISGMDRSNGIANLVADPIHTSIARPDIGSWLVRGGEVCE